MKNMLNKKRFLYIITIILGISIPFLFTSGHFILANKSINTKIDKIVKEKKLTKEQTQEMIISGLFYHINKNVEDIHSVYMNKDNYKEFNQSLNSTLVGIGIKSSRSENDTLKVVKVYDNTPAKKSGLKEKDIIIGVDNINFKDHKKESLVKFITGKENTSLVLKILRDNKKMEIKTTRASLSLPQVEVQNLNKDTTIAKISSFGSDVASEFATKVVSNVLPQTKNLIIDVRSNGGGSLVEVEKIISLFVRENQNIVIKKSSSGTNIDKSEKLALVYDKETKKPQLKPISDQNKDNVVDLSKYKVKILVDQNSASASEILTITLKELINARLYGTKTYGKGSVQQLIPLSDNSAFKLSVEKWFSSKNTGIDKKGIDVDVKIENNKSYYNAVDSELNKNDLVLKKALEEIKNGR